MYKKFLSFVGWILFATGLLQVFNTALLYLHYFLNSGFSVSSISYNLLGLLLGLVVILIGFIFRKSLKDEMLKAVLASGVLLISGFIYTAPHLFSGTVYYGFLPGLIYESLIFLLVGLTICSPGLILLSFYEYYRPLEGDYISGPGFSYGDYFHRNRYRWLTDDVY